MEKYRGDTTTCAACNRALWKKDANSKGLCPDCSGQPAPAPAPVRAPVDEAQE